MNDNGKYQYIIVRCGDSEMMVMYSDMGVTLVSGEQNQDGDFVIESTMELPFSDHADLKGLFVNEAWDGPSLLALIKGACSEVSSEQV